MSEYKPKYFTLRELTRSDTANRLGIVNDPSDEVRQSLLSLCQHVLDPLREAWGGPITVNSGYRCPKLNEAVGGSPTSSHMTGQAADITVGSKAKNKELYALLKRLGLSVDQAIREKETAAGPQWLHISYKSPLRNRNQFFAL